MRFHRVGLALLLLYSVGMLGAPDAMSAGPRNIGFELTGTVLDVTTKQPIEGAYVIASYFEVFTGDVRHRSWCLKTNGMRTGKDGRFHFPVEKLDGNSPGSLSAIKSDYRYAPAAPVNRDVWRKQSAASYADRILYLAAQDPAKPDFHFGLGEEFCEHATTREAAAASLEFFKISLQEKIKYGAPEHNIEGNRDLIRMLESLPSR